MTASRYNLVVAALVAAIFVCGAVTPAAAQSAKRSGIGPCRQGALAIIAMLDRKEDHTAEYRHAYDGLVQTCGPMGEARMPTPSDVSRTDCGKLALAVLDAIEEGKMNTKGFVEVRARFAAACEPR